jgi:hypothetical protein
MEKQMQIVEQVGQQISAKSQAIAIAQAAFDRAVQQYKNAQSGGDDRDSVETLFDPANIFGSVGGGEKKDYDAYRVSVSSAQLNLDQWISYVLNCRPK